MALYISPLVDVLEESLPSVIPAAATSIAITVLRNTWKGPELKRQFIINVDNLVDIFGEPTDDSYKDMLSATGYLRYGTSLYCTRALPVSASFAGTYDTMASDMSFTGYTTNNAYILNDLAAEDPDELGDESLMFDAGQPEDAADIMFLASSRGSHGNYIKIAIVGKNVYDTVVAGTAFGSISSDLYSDIGTLVAPFDRDSDTEFIVLVKAAEQEDINKATVPYSVVESHFVSVDPRKIDDEGKNIFCESVINSESNYIRMAIDTTLESTNVSGAYSDDYISLTGGQDNNGDSVSDADIIEAFELYENPDDLDVNVFIDSDKSVTVKQNILSICSSRLDAMALIDVPQSLVVNNKSNEATDMRDFRLGNHSTYNLNESSSYGTIYGNWLNMYDKWNARYRWVPMSGHAAGIFANTDDISESWFAPAGLNRALLENVRKLAFNPSQSERDMLYKVGINPVASFAGQGKVIWGQKTMLDKSSAFNRINVRRLFMVLEKSISTVAKYFIFEPNDAYSRLLLVDMIDPFLRDIKARRGVYDYLVVCNSTNNTPERIDRGELWCDMWIKPTKAAEYIVLRFIATKSGASFVELGAAESG